MSADNAEGENSFIPKASRQGGSTCRFARQPWHGMGEVQTMRDAVAVRKLQLQQLLRRGFEADGKAERDAWSLEVDPARPELPLSLDSRPDAHAHAMGMSLPASAPHQGSTSLAMRAAWDVARRQHEHKLAMLAIACGRHGQSHGVSATSDPAHPFWTHAPDQQTVRSTPTAEPSADPHADAPKSHGSALSPGTGDASSSGPSSSPSPATSPPVGDHMQPSSALALMSASPSSLQAAVTKPPPFFSGSVYTVWDPDNMRLLSVVPTSRLDGITRWLRRKAAQLTGGRALPALGWWPWEGGSEGDHRGSGAQGASGVRLGEGNRRSQGDDDEAPKIVPVRLYLSQRVAEEDMRRGMRGESAVKRAAVVALPLQLALGSQKVLPALGKEIELVPDDSDVEAARRILQRTAGKQAAVAFSGVPVFSISNTRVLVTNRKTGSTQWYRPWFFSKSHMVAMLSSSLDAAFQEKIEARRKARAAALASGGGGGGGRSSLGNDTGMMDVDEDEALEEPSEVRDFLAEATGTSDSGTGAAAVPTTSLLGHVAADLADRVLLGTSLGRRLLGLQVPFDIVVDSFDHCLKEGTTPARPPGGGADPLVLALATPRTEAEAPPLVGPPSLDGSANGGKPRDGGSNAPSSGIGDAGHGGGAGHWGDAREGGRNGADDSNQGAAAGGSQGGPHTGSKPPGTGFPFPPPPGQVAGSQRGSGHGGGDSSNPAGTDGGKGASKGAGAVDDSGPWPHLGSATTVLGSGSLTANELAKLPLVDDGMTGVMFIADASLTMQPPQRVSTKGGDSGAGTVPPLGGGGDLD
eukprot:jgi/Mesvir1/18713/Mv12424-RA.1